MTITCPPHDVWTEQACLGALIFGRREDLKEEAMSLLRAEDFFGIAHQQIYSAVCDIVELEGETEALKLRNRLSDKGQLELCGGVGYLMGLGEAFTISENLPYYVSEVRKLSALRMLMRLKDIAEKAGNPAADVEELVDDVRTYIDSIRLGSVKTVEHAGVAVVRALAVMEKRSTGERTGLDFGISAIDVVLTPMDGGTLTVIGGLPGRGKTALAGQVVVHQSVTGRVPCAVFSAEMPSWQLVVRMAALLSGVSMSEINRGDWPAASHEVVSRAFQDVHDAPLWIDESSGVDIDVLVDRARGLVEREHVRLIVVDYIQRLTTRSSDQRNLQVAYISKRLKDLSAECDVAVLALSQLTINPDGSANLRWAREVEQDADVVLFLQGDAGAKHGWDAEGPEPDRDIVIEKNRHGPTGRAQLTFFKAAMRFGPRMEKVEQRTPHYAADL